MVPSSLYLDVTRELNAGRTRAILCSGQAVVLHGLAFMSKDGDWILREDEECLSHVLRVLAAHEARYRFGAPLDRRWLSQGWSSHLEFRSGPLRVRTDFFTRPPRLDATDLERLWKEQDGRDPPFTDAKALARMKMTDREKDWPVIGELARRMASAEDQLLFSRSATDLQALVSKHPVLAMDLAPRRPLLARVTDDRRALQTALDAERYELMREDEARLARYAAASEPWAAAWPTVSAGCEGLPLLEAHRAIVARAEGLLPYGPGGAS